MSLVEVEFPFPGPRDREYLEEIQRTTAAAIAHGADLRDAEIAALRKQLAEQDVILHDLLAEHPDYGDAFRRGQEAIKERAVVAVKADSRWPLRVRNEAIYQALCAIIEDVIRALPLEDPKPCLDPSST